MKKGRGLLFAKHLVVILELIILFSIVEFSKLLTSNWTLFNLSLNTLQLKLYTFQVKFDTLPHKADDFEITLIERLPSQSSRLQNLT